MAGKSTRVVQVIVHILKSVRQSMRCDVLMCRHAEKSRERRGGGGMIMN